MVAPVIAPVFYCAPGEDEPEAKPEPQPWPKFGEAVDPAIRRRTMELHKDIEAGRSWVGLQAEADDLLTQVMRGLKEDVAAEKEGKTDWPWFWRRKNVKPSHAEQIDRLVEAKLLTLSAKTLAGPAFGTSLVGLDKVKARFKLLCLVIEQGVEHRAWASGAPIPGRMAPPPPPKPAAKSKGKPQRWCVHPGHAAGRCGCGGRRPAATH